jgi:hypothetical protein
MKQGKIRAFNHVEVGVGLSFFGRDLDFKKVFFYLFIGFARSGANYH